MANEENTEQQDNPVVTLLEETRSLLGSGGKRGKPGALAYDGEGNAVDPKSDKAQSYTIGGALQKAVHKRGGDSTGVDTVHVLLGIGNLSDGSISGLDGLDDKEIGKRFEKAIATAKGEKWTDPDEGKDEESEEEKTRRARDSDREPTVDNPNNPAGNKIQDP